MVNGPVGARRASRNAFYLFHKKDSNSRKKYSNGQGNRKGLPLPYKMALQADP